MITLENLERVPARASGAFVAIGNFDGVHRGHAHLLARLHRQAQATGDTRLAHLHDELKAYPGGESEHPQATDVVVPLRYRGDREELSFISITAMVGTPMDVTVEELVIESFYPADEKTAQALSGRPGP